MLQKYELCGWTKFFRGVSTQKRGEEIKTDVARQAVYIHFPVQAFNNDLSSVGCYLGITIHSNKRKPFAFQLLYYDMTYASTSLI